jgi:hypothetical protein
MELLLPPILALLPLVILVLVPWTFFAIAELFEGFPRIGFRRAFGLLGLVALVAGTGLAFYLFEVTDSSEELLFLVMLIPILGWLVIGPVMFCGMWVREFRLLMLRRDDEFPGRSDKLAWIFALTILAPAGVWMYRSFRLAHWPAIVEPVPTETEALASEVA